MNTDQTREALRQAALNYQHSVASEYRLKNALAEHEAAVRADELRKAADEIDGFYFGPDQDMPFTTGARHKWGAMQAAERLRARADLVEAGEVEA